MLSLAKKYKASTQNPFSFPWHKSPKRAVIISGEARSGTTWLVERLSAGYPFRSMFEPLYPKQVPESSPFWGKPYLEVGEPAPEHKAVMDHILTGTLNNDWINKYNLQRYDSFRLVKFIRANILLPWLQECYPNTPIIMLIRHPLAVAASKTRYGWGAPALERQLEYKPLYNALPELYSVEPPQDLFTKNVLKWCIGHAIPLRFLDFSKQNIRVMHYEHLVCNPEEGIKQLLPLLPKRFNLDAALQENNTPSATSAQWSPSRDFEASLGNWKHSVTDKQIETTLELLKLFKLDTLYSDEIMPLKPIAI